jgi:hypothetical protein
MGSIGRSLITRELVLLHELQQERNQKKKKKPNSCTSAGPVSCCCALSLFFCKNEQHFRNRKSYQVFAGTRRRRSMTTTKTPVDH